MALQNNGFSGSRKKPYHLYVTDRGRDMLIRDFGTHWRILIKAIDEGDEAWIDLQCDTLYTQICTLLLLGVITFEGWKILVNAMYAVTYRRTHR